MRRFLLVVMAAALLAGCGGDDEDSTTTVALSECSLSSRDEISAGSWGGSVSGISCADAGRFIRDHAIPDFDPPGRFTQLAIEHGEPGSFDSAAFDCAYTSLPDGWGWYMQCRRGDQVVGFELTP